jgi:predicted nucleic acid-binding protein
MLSLRLEIDTNVLISDAISLLPAAHRSAACHYQTGPLYVSRPLLEGYSEVLSQPAAAAYSESGDGYLHLRLVMVQVSSRCR